MSGFMHANGSFKRANKNRPYNNSKEMGCGLVFIIIGLLGFISVLLNLKH